MLEQTNLDPAVEKALEILESLNQNHEARQIYESRLRYRVDQKTREKYAQQEEGHSHPSEASQLPDDQPQAKADSEASEDSAYKEQLRLKAKQIADVALEKGWDIQVISLLSHMTDDEIMKLLEDE